MESQSSLRFDHKMNYDFAPAPPAGNNLSQNLQTIEQAQLVRQLEEADLAYMFKHALVQDTAYSTLLKQERHRLHFRVAAALEHAYPNGTNALAATLAEHYWASETWDRAVEYALRAGAGALRVYAVREALHHFERALTALSHLPNPPMVPQYDAEMGWAEAAAKIRPYPEQLQHLARAEQIARDLQDQTRLARTLYHTAGVHTAQGHGPRSIAPLAECFTIAHALGDERLTVLPTFGMGLALMDSDPEQAITFFQRAIELAQRYQDPDTEGTAWVAQAMAHARLGQAAAAKTALARGQTLISQVKSPMTTSDIYLFSGWTAFDLGDVQQGLEFGQRSVATALAADNMDCVCYAYACVGFNEMANQQLPQAVTAFQEAIRRSVFSGADLFENLGRAGLAMAQYFSGESAALAELEQAHLQAQALHNEMGSAIMAQALGGIYTGRGEPARAETSLQAAVAYFRRTHLTPYLLRTLEMLAQLYTQQDRRAEAEQVQSEIHQAQASLTSN